MSRGDASREAILTAALRVVGREGLPASSLGAIAKEAGTSKPAVLYHFGSRENLLREMCARAFQLFQNDIMAGVHGSSEPPGLEHVFSLKHRPILAAARELMSLGQRDPIIGEMVGKCFGEIERAVALLMPDSVSDPLDRAEDIVRSAHGFVQVWLCSGDDNPEPYKEGTRRTIARIMS